MLRKPTRILFLLWLLILASDDLGRPQVARIIDLIGLDTTMPFCEVARLYYVPPEVLAGVYFTKIGQLYT